MKQTKVFLIAFGMLILLYLAIDFILLIYSRYKECSIHVRQDSIYQILKNNRSDSTNAYHIPKDLNAISINSNEYYLCKSDSYYYADAWDRPDKVLLKRRVGSFYYLIFGNGTTATVTYWSDYRSDKHSVQHLTIGPSSASKYIFGMWWFLIPGGMCIGVAIFMMDPISRKKKNREIMPSCQ